MILYYFGGVYHDLKFVSGMSLIEYLNKVSDDVVFIGEEHPEYTHRVRNGNIVSLEVTCKFLHFVLQAVKTRLIAAKIQNHRGPSAMFNIASGAYIDEFKNQMNDHIIKSPLTKWNLVVFSDLIYRRNLKSWQNTDQYIFKQIPR